LAKVTTNKYTIYKPYKGLGAASTWEFAEGKDYGFLTIAPERPASGDNASFDWDSSIKVKLSVTELGGFVEAFLTQTEYKVFHKTDANTKTISIQWAAEKKGFYFNVSEQDVASKDVRKLKHSITPPEARVIATMFQLGIFKMTSTSFFVKDKDE
jgi:hypothetical protein